MQGDWGINPLAWGLLPDRQVHNFLESVSKLALSGHRPKFGGQNLLIGRYEVDARMMVVHSVPAAQ